MQYPIWVDRDEEDIEIAAEYERMFADIDFIANSFDAHEPNQNIVLYDIKTAERQIFNRRICNGTLIKITSYR